MNAAMHSSIPLRRESICDLPFEIRQLIRLKNYVRRLTQDPRFNDRAHRSYLNSLKRQVDEAVANHMNILTTNRLRNLRPHDNQMYVH